MLSDVSACSCESTGTTHSGNQDDESNQVDDERETAYLHASSADRVFASQAKLFADGVSSGDVIQGNLGDCWFLSTSF